MVTKKGYVSIDGTERGFTFEVEENAINEEIDKPCWEAGIEYIDCWWEDENYESD